MIRIYEQTAMNIIFYRFTGRHICLKRLPLTSLSCAHVYRKSSPEPAEISLWVSDSWLASEPFSRTPLYSAETS